MGHWQDITNYFLVVLDNTIILIMLGEYGIIIVDSEWLIRLVGLLSFQIQRALVE